MCPTDWFKLNDETEAPVNAQRAQIASDYDGLLRVPMPTLYYEESAAREMSTIATDLNTYVNEMVALFVTGEADIESGWQRWKPWVPLAWWRLRKRRMTPSHKKVTRWG